MPSAVVKDKLCTINNKKNESVPYIIDINKE